MKVILTGGNAIPDERRSFLRTLNNVGLNLGDVCDVLLYEEDTTFQMNQYWYLISGPRKNIWGPPVPTEEEDISNGDMIRHYAHPDFDGEFDHYSIWVRREHVELLKDTNSSSKCLLKSNYVDL